MKIAGVVAEYNPFHSGHKYQIDTLKSKMGFDSVVAVMSPCVVQRGEPALFPVDVRVQAALKSGVDLIIELPAPYATMSAEGFARAGVELIAALGCVDTIAFGSEAGNTQEILKAKSALTGTKFEQILSENLSKGMEFAKAMAKAAGALYPEAEKTLSTPNNILGVEYCKAISELGVSLTPLAMRREGAWHDESIIESGTIQSATSMRKLIRSGNDSAFYKAVPPECEPVYKNAIENGEIINEVKFEIAVLSRLRGMTTEQFSEIRSTNEGLEHRLANAVQKARSLEELYTLLKCRRYSHARMRRLVLDAALGVSSKIPKSVPYLHVLGATEKGIGLIKLANAYGEKPISPSLAELQKTSLDAESVVLIGDSAENLAALCYEKPRKCGTVFTSFMQKV